MIDRVEQFDGQAAEHARLRALHDAEANGIAKEIIDNILAERDPREMERSARESEVLERELETLAARIEGRGEIETGTLPAIRRAMMVRQVRENVALTLAYRLGSRDGRRATRNAAALIDREEQLAGTADERAQMTFVERTMGSGTDSLPDIHRSLTVNAISVPAALALAYLAGASGGRDRARRGSGCP